MNKSDKSKGAPQPGRRRALKTAVLGGAAVAATPEKWTRPVVDSILLPAHATTTGVTASQPVENLLTPNGSGLLVADESFPGILLEDFELEAEQEAAAQAMNMNLSDLLVSPAHATGSLQLNFTTRYYIENLGSGTDFNFTSLRIYDNSHHRWFASGTLKLNEAVLLHTQMDCGQMAYHKEVTLLDVNAEQATIQVSLLGIPLYTKVIPYNPDATPDVC